MTLPVSQMISVEEARERILQLIDRMPSYLTPIDEALWQVLANKVIAPFDIPPLDNTAMDGYAVRANDIIGASKDAPVLLKNIGVSAAGHTVCAPWGEVNIVFWNV